MSKMVFFDRSARVIDGTFSHFWWYFWCLLVFVLLYVFVVDILSCLVHCVYKRTSSRASCAIPVNIVIMCGSCVGPFSRAQSYTKMCFLSCSACSFPPIAYRTTRTPRPHHILSPSKQGTKNKKSVPIHSTQTLRTHVTSLRLTSTCRNSYMDRNNWATWIATNNNTEARACEHRIVQHF